jgi:hypothetical protein
MEADLLKQMERRKKKAAAKAAKAAKQKETEGEQAAEAELGVTNAPEPVASEKPMMPEEGENDDPNESTASAAAVPVELKKPSSVLPDAEKETEATRQDLLSEPEKEEAPEEVQQPAEPTNEEGTTLAPPVSAETNNEGEKSDKVETPKCQAKASMPPPPAPKAPDIDSDLQAKLAARRARAEDDAGAPAPIVHKKKGPAEPRAAGSDEFQAKMAASRARAEGRQEGEKKSGEVRERSGREGGKEPVGRTGGADGRESLVKFLQQSGELAAVDAAADDAPSEHNGFINGSAVNSGALSRRSWLASLDCDESLSEHIVGYPRSRTWSANPDGAVGSRVRSKRGVWPAWTRDDASGA